MKRNYFYALIALILAAAMSSCINDKEEIVPGGNQNIRLYVAGVETRTTIDNINIGNVHTSNYIGAYGFVSGSLIENCSNVKYSVSERGNMTGDKDMVVKENSSVTICAYAPYNKDWEKHDIHHTFTVSSNQSKSEEYMASDLLFANETKTITAADYSVGLNFSHKLARVQLTINKDAQVGDLKNMTIKIKNTKLSTTFQPSSGEVETANDEVLGTTSEIIIAEDIEITTTPTTAYGIIIPQSVVGNTELFCISNDNKEYTVKLQNGIQFVGGNSYAFTITIMPKDVNLTINSTIVTDWDTQTVNNDDYALQETEDGSNTLMPEILNLDIKNFVLGGMEKNSNSVWNSETGLYQWNRNMAASSTELVECKKLYLIPEDTNLKNEEYKKYKSLVIVLSDYSSNGNDESLGYILLRTSDNGIFKTDDKTELHINASGTYAIDLTRYGNEELLDEKSGLRFNGFSSDVRAYAPYYYSVKIKEVYFTTQNVEEIN